MSDEQTTLERGARKTRTGVVVSTLLRNAGARELGGMQMPAPPAWPACRRVPVRCPVEGALAGILAGRVIWAPVAGHGLPPGNGPAGFLLGGFVNVVSCDA